MKSLTQKSQFRLDKLVDVEITDPIDWQALVYDGVSHKYVNGEWGGTSSSFIAWDNITITNQTWPNYSAVQWPCPNGFHVPSKDEVDDMKTILTALSAANFSGVKEYLHIAPAGSRKTNGDQAYVDTSCDFRTRDADTTYNTYATSFIANSLACSTQTQQQGTWFNIRPFKNEYVEPDDTWTVETGTLWSAGIFHNATLGIISLTNGSDKNITIADKNVWATVVYDTWDVPSEANSGYYFQWGNNYGFAFSWEIAKVNASIDVSWYEPSTFSNNMFNIAATPYDPTNADLWGGVTGVIVEPTGEKIISARGVDSWNTVTGSTVTISGENFRNQISTNSNITVSVGTGLIPGMEYIVRVTNTDASNAITMTFNSIAYTVPASANINFRFLALTSTTVDFEWPRLLTQMLQSNVEEWKLYFIIS